MDSDGRMWKCSENQLYLVEVLVKPTVEAKKNAASLASSDYG